MINVTSSIVKICGCKFVLKNLSANSFICTFFLSDKEHSNAGKSHNTDSTKVRIDDNRTFSENLDCGMRETNVMIGIIDRNQSKE